VFSLSIAAHMSLAFLRPTDDVESGARRGISDSIVEPTAQRYPDLDLIEGSLLDFKNGEWTLDWKEATDPPPPVPMPEPDRRKKPDPTKPRIVDPSPLPAAQASSGGNSGQANGFHGPNIPTPLPPPKSSSPSNSSSAPTSVPTLPRYPKEEAKKVEPVPYQAPTLAKPTTTANAVAGSCPPQPCTPTEKVVMNPKTGVCGCVPRNG
jgi:hypothetical protein